MVFGALLKENIRVSVMSVRTNLLRTILTVLIIAFGIMALVGILTAIDSIKHTITKQFATMGANTFTVESRGFTVQIGKNRYRKKNHPYINYRQARAFKDRFDFPAMVSVYTNASGMATVKFKSEKTHPNVTVIGSDEDYLATAGFETASGRNLSYQDVIMNRNVALIGVDVANKIFKNNEDPLGKQISIGKGRYLIVGILKKKGSSIGSSDNICIIPYTNVRQYFPSPRQDYSINITPENESLAEAAEGYTEGLFRSVRRLNVIDESDFNIVRSDFLSNIFKNMISIVLIAATIIGVVTLFGAAIGLMNIMLVSVTERTTEIGIRKAIGARSSVIKQQFLFRSHPDMSAWWYFGRHIRNFHRKYCIFNYEIRFSGAVVMDGCRYSTLFYCRIDFRLLPGEKASRLDPIVALRYE